VKSRSFSTQQVLESKSSPWGMVAMLSVGVGGGVYYYWQSIVPKHDLVPVEVLEGCPQCFMDVSVDDVPQGRITVQLRSDVAPKTAENFVQLCEGMRGSKGQVLGFAGSPFHRVIPGFMCQGGDVVEGNGRGNMSIYGPAFSDESFELKHQPGCLSMANAGPDTNGSQFFICMGPTGHLDGKHVVFGHITSGWDVVQHIEAQGSRSGRVKSKVIIDACGKIS